MNKLTADLLERTRGLIKIEPEVSDPSGPYSCYDSGAVECEIGEFLWGLVRMLKPLRCLSTGVYTGVSDLYISQGLKDNGFGHLTALEVENTHKSRAEKLWRLADLESFVECKLEDSLSFQPEGQYDLMFLDSEPHLRFAELERFYPFLRPGGYIGIHDCPPSMCQGNINPDHSEIKSYPFGDIPTDMANWIKTSKLVKFHLPNPRGSTWFYKPKEDDYQVK